MANLHGLAGQYGKKMATQRYWRILLTFVGFACYGLAALGFAAGYTWSRGGPILASAAVFASAGLFWVLWRIAIPYMDRMAKERIKYLRGGQAEALVAWLLDDLPDDWHVFNTVKLEAESDIDHVVVGPGGVYCISTKSQRGLFTGTPDGLLYNGQPSSFAQQALRQAMDLKDRLAVAMGRDVPWIQPVLALPLGFIEADACAGKVWLVHQESIVERLAPENGAKKLSRDQITRLVTVLKMIQSSAAEVYRRPVAQEATGSP